MGYSAKVKCLDCGKIFRASYGGGFTFELLHCDKCGKQKSVSRSLYVKETVDYAAIKCKCGGSYSIDALPRCPRCRSAKTKEIGSVIMCD